MKLIPLDDRIIVEVVESVTKTDAGIVIINKVMDKPNQGKVLAVGPGKWDAKTGGRKPLTVAVGDAVLFPANAGIPIKFEGTTYFFMKEIDMLGVIS